jgi:hypothetical protein
MSPAVAKPIKIMSREGSKSYPETESAVYNLIWEWLTDDAGKNMLREPNGKERYPDFDLYAAIATDVHRAVPSAQIEKSVFLPFRSEVAPTESEGDVFDLWV